VRLLLERLDARDISWLEHIASMAAQPGEQVLETRLDRTGQRKTLHPRKDWPHDLETGFLGHDACVLQDRRPTRDTCAVFFEKVKALPPTVMLFGAGHVGQAIAHILSISDLSVRWFDSRQDYSGTRSGVDISQLTDPEDTIEMAPPAAIHLVLTHDHELDYRLIRAILQRGDFAFCGLIGSATKRARFIRRLREDGVPQAAISRLTSPIGLPEVSGKAPATIAVSVAGQIMQMTDDRVSAGKPHQASSASVLRA
jgi:xanthine dehydrogenase accessory factor